MNFSFSLSDHELVWKYVDWVLSKDPEAGVQVNIPVFNIMFTSR